MSNLKNLKNINFQIKEKTYITEASKEILKGCLKDMPNLNKATLNGKDVFSYI